MDVVSMVDLDLDVIQRVTGELLIDDEDEFEEGSAVIGLSAGDRDAGADDNRCCCGRDRRRRRALRHRRTVVADELFGNSHDGPMRSRTVRTRVSGSNGFVT